MREMMRVTITIQVEQAELWHGDSYPVGRKVEIESDNPDAARIAAAGVCSTLNTTVQDAINERIFAETEDPTDDE